MGLEAESRGAQQVVCVDKDIRFLNENIALLGATVNGVRSDAIRYLKTLQKSAFDFIYFDPVWADHHVYCRVNNHFRNQLVSESVSYLLSMIGHLLFQINFSNISPIQKSMAIHWLQCFNC